MSGNEQLDKCSCMQDAERVAAFEEIVTTIHNEMYGVIMEFALCDKATMTIMADIVVKMIKTARGHDITEDLERFKRCLDRAVEANKKELN